MNDETIQDESNLFDRLVDGELTPDERRALLLSLDDQPVATGWRACALAFLESQAWRDDLGQVVQGVEKMTSETGQAAAVWGDGRWLARRAVQWLAIAASLLVTFVLGMSWRGGGSPVSDVSPDTAQLAGMDSPVEAPAPLVVQPNDSLTFWVRDDTGGSQPIHVPLVDAATLDRQLGVEFRSGLPDGVRQHLQSHGYDVQSKRRYAPLWFENGRSLVVPVEDTRIVPVGQIVY